MVSLTAQNANIPLLCTLFYDSFYNRTQKVKYQTNPTNSNYKNMKLASECSHKIYLNLGYLEYKLLGYTFFFIKAERFIMEIEQFSMILKLECICTQHRHHLAIILYISIWRCLLNVAASVGETWESWWRWVMPYQYADTTKISNVFNLNVNCLIVTMQLPKAYYIQQTRQNFTMPTS